MQRQFTHTIRSQPARVACAALCAALSVGCWRPPAATIVQEQRGLVWMFPGIEGQPWSLESAHRGFRDAGVEAAIRAFDWQQRDSLTNLRDLPGNRKKAAEVAQAIDEYSRAHPDAPVDLVGYSGGGGIALLVVEALQALAGSAAALDASASLDTPARSTHVRNVMLVQPAVSPDYDLTPALSAINGRLINFYSPRDWFILGAGTTVFGTIDRKFVASAGKNGFDASKAIPDESLRTKLLQVAWTNEMLADGHGGDHLGGLWSPWNRKYIAPYLK